MPIKSISRMEIIAKAKDIVGVLQMWDINQADSLAIIREMMLQAGAISPANWTNPLEGTGLKVVGPGVEPLPGLGGPQ